MIVINFCKFIKYIKGIALNHGVNIVNDGIITYDDRTHEIGVGVDDYKHYSNLIQFFECDIYTTITPLINELYQQLTENKQLIVEFSKHSVSMLNDYDSTPDRFAADIVSLKKKNDAIKLRLNAFLQQCTFDELPQQTINMIESCYSTLNVEKFNFTMTKVATAIYNDIKANNRRVLPLDIYIIKNNLC